ncbi:MAG: tetratricopeptide repeat protein [Myxococcales bacterium]|nr:tetratricopeptide repeat protein [Myxococcales bacterium]
MLLLLARLALADDATCLACCRAGGIGDCPTSLEVRTEWSATEPLATRWELMGAWVLACDGSGRFDSTITRSLDHEPDYGEVIGSGRNPLAVHCFTQACALPRGVCVGPASANGDVGLVGCEDTLAVDQKSLAVGPGRSPGRGAVVVVIDGRPLVAEPGEPAAPSPGSGPEPSPAPPPSAPWPAPTPPGAAAPSKAPLPVPVLELPPDPPDPCAPPADAIRSESRKRVGTGDDLRITAKSSEALRDYKAALTLDTCNGYAWMSIAQLAGDQARTDLTIRALRNATRLLPAHPGAWLMLGRAYESFGQRGLAAQAFKRATELAPGSAEAVEGYMRTR